MRRLRTRWTRLTGPTAVTPVAVIARHRRRRARGDHRRDRAGGHQSKNFAAAPGHRAGKPVEPWDVASMIGSGDLCSTAEDLVAYARAVEDGGLVSPASLALMRTRHSTFIEPDRTPDGRLEVTGYGYGHYVGTFDGRPAALHTGDNPGYRSLFGWLPDGVGIVALSNEDSVRWEDVLSRVL